MKRILLTGFVPFGDLSVNPSETLVRDLHHSLKGDPSYQFDLMIFPVDYQKVDTKIKAIDFSEYDFVFQFGVARGRHCISLERVALNWTESSIPDNSGVYFDRRPIDISGAKAVFNSLDLFAISEKLNQKFGQNLLEVSFSAGAYLCNYIYFKTITQTPNCLFVHIPNQLKTALGERASNEDGYRNCVSDICLDLIRDILK